MNRPYQAPSQLLAIFFPPLPCPDIASGTLHLVFPPLLQPIPRFNRWFGQIVMVLHLTGLKTFQLDTRYKGRVHLQDRRTYGRKMSINTFSTRD